MNLRLLLVVIAMTFCAAAGTAQSSCPKTKTLHVPERFSWRGQQTCPGITFNLGGANVTTPSQNCPLVGTYYPDHEIEVSSDANTKVTVHAQAPSYIFYFACVQDWLFIVPWGSVCNMTGRFNNTPVMRMTTIPCPK